MSVKLLKGRWYLDCWPQGSKGHRHREWLPDRIKTEAQATGYEKLFLSVHRKKGIPAVPHDSTIKSLWPRYADYIETNYESGHTRVACADSARFIIPFCGDVSVIHVNNELPEYLKQRCKQYTSVRTGKHISAASINKHLGHLSGFLRYCREVLSLPVPIITIKYLRLNHKTPTILTPTEAQRFLTVCPPVYRALFGFCFLCGLRSHEARYITWSDISESILTVRGKGGRERRVPVPVFIMSVLEQLPHDNEYIFYNPVSGKPLANLRRAIESACKKAGIDKHISPHSLRHSLGAAAIEAQQDIRVLQKFLGHSRIQMTEHYSQVFGGSLKELSDRVIDLIDLP